MDMSTKYNQIDQNLKDAKWFAERGQVATAISIVEDTFDNFMDFRVWWLASYCDELGEKFSKWVAKIMVLFYDGHCNGETQIMVGMTYNEIYNK